MVEIMGEIYIYDSDISSVNSTPVSKNYSEQDYVYLTSSSSSPCFDPSPSSEYFSSFFENDVEDPSSPREIEIEIDTYPHKNVEIEMILPPDKRKKNFFSKFIRGINFFDKCFKR